MPMGARSSVGRMPDSADRRSGTGRRASPEPPKSGRAGRWVVPPSGGSDQPVLVGPGGGGGPRGHPELGEDVADVAVHGALAQHQLGGDGPVGLAGGDQPQHLDLAGGQAAGRPGRAAGGQRLDPGQVGGGPEPLVGPAGRVQLQGGRVLVAQGPAGQPDALPGPGAWYGASSSRQAAQAARRAARVARGSPSASRTAPSAAAAVAASSGASRSAATRASSPAA